MALRYLSDIISWPQESCLTAAATFYLAATLHFVMKTRKLAVYYAAESIKMIERHLRGEDGQIDFVEGLELRMFQPSITMEMKKNPKPEEFRHHALFMAATLLSADSFHDEALQLAMDGLKHCTDPIVAEAFEKISKLCIKKITDQNKRLTKARLQAYRQNVDERALQDGISYKDLSFYQDRDRSCPQRIAIGGTNPKLIDLDLVRNEISFLHNPVR